MARRRDPDNKKNLGTERAGISYLRRKDSHVHSLSKEQRKWILNFLNLDSKKFGRSFDLVRLKVRKFELVKRRDDFELLEVKVTRKNLPNFPEGFFFGMTKNEENLMKKMGRRCLLCLVSLGGRRRVQYMTLKKLKSLIKRKRIQYQINL